MANPTVSYFGTNPTTIVMQSTGNLDGSSPQTSAAVLSPGMYIFPAQSGGGLYNFHETTTNNTPIEVIDISYYGGGTLTVAKKFTGVGNGSSSAVVGTVSTDGTLTFQNGQMILVPGIDLSCSSSGGSSAVVAITARVRNSSGAGF